MLIRNLANNRKEKQHKKNKNFYKKKTKNKKVKNRTRKIENFQEEESEKSFLRKNKKET